MSDRPPITKVPLGSQGLAVSSIGLGCMVMSGLYGQSDRDESSATLRLALELGVDFLDTADKYADGANEELLGSVLSTVPRDRVVLATKFGLVDSSGDELVVDNDPRTIARSCEASLRRLRTDHLDLYYAHRLDPEVPVEETVGAMAELVTQGKVRFLGLCEVTGDEVRRAHATHPLSALQSEWSLFARDGEADAFAVAQQLGIGIVPYAPLGRGFLTGALTDPASELTDRDHRRRDPRFAPDALEGNLALLAQLRTVAERHRATPAQVAIAWLLHQPARPVPIPGAERRSHLLDDLGALELRLSEDDLDLLERTFAPGAVKGRRPNTATRSARSRALTGRS